MQDNYLNNLSGKLSLRSAIDPFIVMDVMAEANNLSKNGNDIIHMEVGQPGSPAPATALEAARNALNTDVLGYTEALGIPKLRERISQHYQDTYNRSISPDRVIVTLGSSTAFILAFLACFDAGAKVALPSPGYPCYRHIMTALGIEPYRLELKAEDRWMPNAEQLKAAAQAENLQGLILASPANPTGTMLKDDVLEALVKASEAQNMWFISDEIYHGLTYEQSAQSALRYSDAVIVINSFSKYFSMTGWRIGWMVVPEVLVRPIERLAQNLFISTPTISQYAALGAFDGRDELEGHRTIYAKNRLMLLEELQSAGLTEILPADGAFYLYADISRYSDDSVGFAKKMLHEIGVAITPGVDFDELRGQHYIRFSYAGKFENMLEAAKRIKGWLG